MSFFFFNRRFFRQLVSMFSIMRASLWTYSLEHTQQWWNAQLLQRWRHSLRARGAAWAASQHPSIRPVNLSDLTSLSITHLSPFIHSFTYTASHAYAVFLLRYHPHLRTVTLFSPLIWFPLMRHRWARSAEYLNFHWTAGQHLDK